MTFPSARWVRQTAAIAMLALVAIAISLVPTGALAAPAAKLLRVDPRASLVDGAPILTTVVDLVQHKGVSEVSGKCARYTGNANIDCMARELQKPEALYDPFKFPDKNAYFTVSVDGRDVPTTFVSKKRWRDAKADDYVGTAFLILVDASASMGGRFSEAKAVAQAFIDTKDAHDIFRVMFFNDRQIVEPGKWVDSKSKALSDLNKVTSTFPRQGRTRQLFQIIKQGATDGFGGLGNTDQSVAIPMHQSMVVLSNGASGSDIGSAAQTAIAVSDYLTGGRFPESNETLPKAPVPVISIWFPTKQSEEFFQNARQFMENLANPQIGGFFGIIRDGKSSSAGTIVNSVRRRFDQMHIVKWRVPCIAPQVAQTFRLFFQRTSPLIGGDNFKNVPVGIDPSTWPLDVNLEATAKYAKKNKVHPGGTIKIFGDFCWASDHKRAQLYMIPKNQPAPQSLKGQSMAEAKKMQQQLIASKMVGKPISAGNTFVEFEVPDTTKFLSGSGSKMTARMVVVDTNAARTSAVTADKIITLPAEKKPLNLLLIGGLTFGGVILLLLLVSIFRGGGGRKRGGGSRRGGGGGGPAPLNAGGGYPPPGGFRG